MDKDILAMCFTFTFMLLILGAAIGLFACLNYIDTTMPIDITDIKIRDVSISRYGIDVLTDDGDLYKVYNNKTLQKIVFKGMNDNHTYRIASQKWLGWDYPVIVDIKVKE
jgi:hypothetical protein